MPDTFIFDLDGTLIDSAPGILATYAKILSDANISPAVPLDPNLIGPPLLPTLEKLLGYMDPPLLIQLADRFKVEYDMTGVRNTPSYAGAHQLLEALKTEGKTLLLATNKRSAPTHALVKKFRWSHLFERIYCIDSSTPAFPDKAAMLRQLLADSMLSASKCIYVGDTQGDLEAASSCGIRFIAAEWGYGTWALDRPAANYASARSLQSLQGLLTGAGAANS